MNAPVVLFTYNRPEHTRRALSHLRAAEGATETDLYIYADGSKNERDKANVDAVREAITNVEGFGSVKVVQRERNIGLAQNIISGVSEVIAKHGRVIVLEDDLVVSPFFLHYINAALDFYEDKNVWSVAGYTPKIIIPTDYQYTNYMVMRNCSWGWGTWLNRWQRADWQVKDFDQFITDREQRRAFNLAGNDLTPMLLKWKIGVIHSWAIRFSYASFVAQMPSVYPVKSLVRNGGADGSGTNVGRTKRYETEVANNLDIYKFVASSEIDERIARQFKAKNDTSLLRQLINFIKRIKYIRSIKVR